MRRSGCCRLLGQTEVRVSTDPADLDAALTGLDGRVPVAGVGDRSDLVLLERVLYGLRTR